MTLHRSSVRCNRPLAACATLALTLTGVFAATPAFAEDPEHSSSMQHTSSFEDVPLTADSSHDADTTAATHDEPLIDASGGPEPEPGPPSSADERTFEAAGIDLVGVGVNADGETVVVTTGGSIDSPAGQVAVEEFVSTYGETDGVTTLELEGPIIAAAAQDLVGGAGYIALNSVSGAAGYCSLGFAAWNPSREPAFITAGHCMSGTDDTVALATIPSEEVAAGGPGTAPSASLSKIGWFEFAQYGGPGGTPGTNGRADSIDIATIDVDTDEGWTLKPAVTDWTMPGQTPGSLAESTTEVERVGLPQVGPIARSGRTTGKEMGTVRPTDILSGWVQVSGRWVHGFSSATHAIPGDSGGAVIQGTTAVGIVSGVATEPGGGPFLWSSLLQEALPATDGYEVALDIEPPLVEPQTVLIDTEVAVATPENATGLTVAVNGQESIVTPSNGVAHVPVSDPGHYAYTLTATNGMSRSEPVTQTVTVAPPAPTITSPTDGEIIDEEVATTRISGTGVEGATVDVALSTLAIAVPATQEPQGSSAQATEDDFVWSVDNYTATVQGGTWSIDVAPARSALVDFGLAATQTVNDVSSAESNLQFTVFGVEKKEITHITPVPPVTPVTPPAKQTVSLAQTGGSDFTAVGIASGAALLLGALVLGAVVTRQNRREKR